MNTMMYIRFSELILMIMFVLSDQQLLAITTLTCVFMRSTVLLIPYTNEIIRYLSCLSSRLAHYPASFILSQMAGCPGYTWIIAPCICSHFLHLSIRGRIDSLYSLASANNTTFLLFPTLMTCWIILCAIFYQWLFFAFAVYFFLTYWLL